MLITPIPTHKISIGEDLLGVLDTYIASLHHSLERSVLAVTSKIISVCEGRVVKMGEANKDALIAQESQFFLPRSKSRYNVSFTITNNMLVPTAGIDESNANGYYVLWPENPQQSANLIREHIVKRFGLREFGVIITDSRTSPLRWGVTATAIAYSGFNPLLNYVGKPDLYGRPFAFEKLGIADSLASSAGVVMGEGAEQTPLAIISDIPYIEFQHRNPTLEELDRLTIDMQDDLYAPLLTSVAWKKGKKFKVTLDRERK